MNKEISKKNKIFKIILITLGMLPFIYAIISVIRNIDYILSQEGSMPIFFSRFPLTSIGSGSIEGLIQLVGIILIIIGIFINSNPQKKLTQKQIIKYKEMAAIGTILFVISIITMIILCIMSPLLFVILFFYVWWILPLSAAIFLIKRNKVLKNNIKL